MTTTAQELTSAEKQRERLKRVKERVEKVAFTRKEVAAMLGVGETEVRTWINTKLLTVRRLPYQKQTKIFKEDLENFLRREAKVVR